MSIKVRIGVPKISGAFPDFAVGWLGAPILVSANSLYDHGNKRFRDFVWKPSTWYGDVALDSAGFVAMSKYGGYPWSVDDYVEMMAMGSGTGMERSRTGHGPFTWWAAMDLCCEPDIAKDHAEVKARVEGTVAMYMDTVRTVRHWRDVEGCSWLTMPMPTIQGWRPDDYLYCLELYAWAFEKLKRERHESQWADHGDEFPPLMGLGSVCQRHLNGADGLLNIVDQVSRALPPGVALHLFGVKGTALPHLRGNPRIHSTDSMAWDFRAQRALRDVRADSGLPYKEAIRAFPYSNEWRMRFLKEWRDKQQARLEEGEARGGDDD